MREVSNLQRLLHEKALGRYLTALERGDIDTIIATLERAEHDPVLERMLLEVHETYQTEEAFLAMVQEESDMEFKDVNFKEGIHKSVLKDELDEVEEELARASAPAPKQSKRARWLSTLAAILVVCLVAGGFLAAHIWQPGQNQTRFANLGSAPAAWCSITSTPLGDLTSITGLAQNDVWATGDGNIEHWDGSQWNLSFQTDGHQEFQSLTELAPNNVWAVGAQYGRMSHVAWPTNADRLPQINSYSEPLIMHWDGTKWQIVLNLNKAANSANMLFSISAVSANDIWAVGRSYSFKNGGGNFTASALLEHWNGQSWSNISDTVGNTVWFTDIKALASNNVWAVGTKIGDATSSIVIHWDGTKWNLVADAAPGDTSGGSILSAIDGSSANDLWAIGNVTNGILIEHWNGKQWSINTPSPIASTNADNLNSIAVAGPDDAWVVGQLSTEQGTKPTIEHWNGQKWQLVPSPLLVGSLNSVAIIGHQPWSVGTLNKADGSTTDKPLLEMPCK